MVLTTPFRGFEKVEFEFEFELAAEITVCYKLIEFIRGLDRFSGSLEKVHLEAPTYLDLKSSSDHRTISIFDSDPNFRFLIQSPEVSFELPGHAELAMEMNKYTEAGISEVVCQQPTVLNYEFFQELERSTGTIKMLNLGIFTSIPIKHGSN